MEVNIYPEEFFRAHESGSSRSAKEIIPFIANQIQPRSVIDIGCGIGTWLRAWESFGVSDIFGVDGEYVQKDQLLISQEKFATANLENGYTAERKFDLVSSLEVAEHLNITAAERFVRSLCNLGKIVLFSAAVPGQGGAYHVNEQYQSYWANIFNRCGYLPVDIVRKRFWSNTNISYWYRQNIILYVEKNALKNHPGIADGADVSTTDFKHLDLIHPELYNKRYADCVSFEQILAEHRKPVRFALKKIRGYLSKKSKQNILPF